ncbi:hypothetical protein MSPP1_000646 [Malassezia sp. CBS 17886]|nr:hypothetical protein MSPP1_000646 [Malassezia sp. CBS 17886]
MMDERHTQTASAPPARALSGSPDWPVRVRSASPDACATRASSPDAGGGRWTARGRAGAQPMRDVILLGLDADIDAEKLRTLVNALADMVHARLMAPPQDVTVIRDRNSGVSKGFGFVKFETLEDAKRFVSMHAPFITNTEPWLGVPPGTDGRTHRKRIKVDYSNSERPQGGVSYYEQHNAPGSKDSLKRARAARTRGDSVPNVQVDVGNENGSLRDASPVPTNMLLLTQVGTAGAADIARALRGLPAMLPHGTTGEAQLRTALAAMEQVLVVRERATHTSADRAVVVFHDTDAARVALSALRRRTWFPDGVAFKHAPRPVRTSYADAAVLEEADPYDPTSAPWTYTDREQRVWRYEDERMGLEVWDAAQESALPSASGALSSPGSDAAVVDAAIAASAASAASAAADTPARFSPTHTALRTLNFADRTRLVCLLCQRQFNDAAILARHAVESTLHETNLNDENACRAGAARIHAHGTAPKENARVLTPPNTLFVPQLVHTKLAATDAHTDVHRAPLQAVAWNAPDAYTSMPTYSGPASLGTAQWT